MFPYVWVYTHQDKPGWYGWSLCAATKEELEQKLADDCGRVIPMQLHSGLVAVQARLEKIPVDHIPYKEIQL